MGWGGLLQPFRALSGRSGGPDSSTVQQQQQHAQQRRYLQEFAEREVQRAAASGNVWCCASHPEHVRPMLQVQTPHLHPFTHTHTSARVHHPRHIPVIVPLAYTWCMQ